MEEVVRRLGIIRPAFLDESGPSLRLRRWGLSDLIRKPQVCFFEVAPQTKRRNDPSGVVVLLKGCQMLTPQT